MMKKLRPSTAVKTPVTSRPLSSQDFDSLLLSPTIHIHPSPSPSTPLSSSSHSSHSHSSHHSSDQDMDHRRSLYRSPGTASSPDLKTLIKKAKSTSDKPLPSEPSTNTLNSFVVVSPPPPLPFPPSPERREEGEGKRKRSQSSQPKGGGGGGLGLDKEVERRDRERLVSLGESPKRGKVSFFYSFGGWRREWWCLL